MRGLEEQRRHESFDIPPGIDPKVAFRVSVQISGFSAKLNDGSCVDVQRKCDEWVVDYSSYTLAKLENDLAARVQWGSSQQLIISSFESSDGEMKLEDDDSLSGFLRKVGQKRLFLYVDVVDKPALESAITEGAMSNIMAVLTNDPAAEPPVIDWNTLEIAPIAEEQIGAALPIMDEDAVYAFVGLSAEDERAERGRAAAEKEDTLDDLVDLEEVELLVNDRVPGEEHVFYDMEDPPMMVGTRYASMKEFRAAVRHHAIKKQFELGTEKSSKERFRGYCKAEGCPWSIVARLMADGEQVRVTLNKERHFCSSTSRIKTKMASYHWVAEKAIPFLKKDQNMGAKNLQKELEEKYQVTIGYSTVWMGRQIAAEKIFGTWEESFGYLFRFKAEVEMRMPGSVVEIELVHEKDGTYFKRFFCCLKPSIDGFLNGCRPYLSIDATALNGRWNGHLASATALDGCNWMFLVAFGFFGSETDESWLWFMQQLHKAIGNPPSLAISSDACKGIAKAVKKVYPWAEHRECFVHLMKNFSKRYSRPEFGRMYPAARTFQPQYHEYLMNKMYAYNKKVKIFLDEHHNLLWMRSKFSEEIKCDHNTNNVAEVWNGWIKDIKDLPIAELADTLRGKFMELYSKRRRIGEKFEGYTMLPLVVRQLQSMSRELGHLKVKEGGREEAEVTEVTASHKIIRHVVNLNQHTCTCREWQEQFLHPYFSVYHFRIAYGGVIRPFPDKSQWAQVELGFRVLPPLTKRGVGRQRKNRIPGCLENKGNKPRTKGLWQVTCKTCFGKGHRSSSPKCPMNGTKKRKSRAKGGRPLGSVTGESSKRGTKKRKTTMQASEANTSPGPVTRSQMQLLRTPPRLADSPAKRCAKKKLTPRKPKRQRKPWRQAAAAHITLLQSPAVSPTGRTEFAIARGGGPMSCRLTRRGRNGIAEAARQGDTNSQLEPPPRDDLMWCEGGSGHVG
ncbi:hypothetical protein U9M48_021722 [Paspalum notatum var. saurae]|uniref:Transposase n=1 Tax=Paspalum notatum var. saurae TaxID=547442 RepID=A0AAQ3TI94_PASNO